MTNYNERLDEILANLGERHIMVEHRLVHLGMPEQNGKNIETRTAKQALTSLIKELVAEAKPPVIDTPSRIKLYADDEGQMWYDRGQNDTIARFDQNLLKALEEV